MAVRRDYIAGLYRDMLGREGSGDEIAGWENAPDEQSVASMFAGSPEYAARTGGQSSWHNDDTGRIVSNTPNASTPPYQIQGGGYDDPGFPGGGTLYPDPSPGGGAPRTFVGGEGSPSSNAIADLYMKYLGRPGSGDDYTKWLSGAYGWGDQNNLAGIERGIATSEEASRHRAATPSTSYDSTPYTGFKGNFDYSAFNTAREQNPGKSAKDAFAMVSNMAPPAPFSNRAALPNWFNSYVRPGFESLGNKVLSVDEDGFVYENHEGTFRVDYVQNAGAPTGSMQQRFQWNATPADEATRARYATNVTPGASRTSGSGAPAPTGTMGDLKSLFQQLGAQFGGPGGPGITTGPLQQVGQDPLSQLITGALVDFIGRGGSTAFGQDVQSTLSEMINGKNPAINSRFESARELMNKGRRTQINDARAALADRNLLSEPGIPQGAETGALMRIEDNIAPEFARALRDIYTEETGNALQLATNMSADQARTFLAGLGEGTSRQTALANIALQSLSQNMAWSKFLAEFGLQRETVMQQLQQGRTDDVMQLLNSFLSLTSLSRGGFV